MNDDTRPVGATVTEVQPRRDRLDGLWSVGLWVSAIVLLTINLGGLPLRDWDEGLVAQVAREIAQAPVDSLTWLYPTLWDEPYFNKPTLVHSLVAIAYHIGGIHEWTARLPSAILTSLSVPLLYGIGREVFYARLPALLAAMVYLTSLPVARHGRLAMLDGAILCFFLLLLLCLLRTRRNARYALGVGLSFGLLCLTKGIMVGLLLGAIALGFLLWDTPRLLTLPYLWLGLGLGSLPVICWYGAQWLHYGPTFWSRNLVDQSLQRIWVDVEQNRGAPWYYLLELLKYGVPWIVFLPFAGKLAWQHRSLSWAKLTLVWVGLYLSAISLMATKLPWYSLPLYPAIALLTGAYLATLWKTGKQTGVKQVLGQPYAPGWISLFGLLAGVSWAGVAYFGRWAVPIAPDLQIVFVALGLTFTLVAGLIYRQNPQFLTVLGWGTYLALILLMLSNHWIWELAESYPVKPVAALIQQQTIADQPVYTSYPYHRPSLNFYSDRPILPAPTRKLRQIWRQESRPYLLLDAAALADPRLEPKQILGAAAGWTLITKAGEG